MVNEEKLSRLADPIRNAGFELDETWEKWNPMLRGIQLRFQFHGMTVDLGGRKGKPTLLLISVPVWAGFHSNAWT